MCPSYPYKSVKEVGGNWNQKSIVEHNMDIWRMDRWKERTQMKRWRKQQWREWIRKQESIYLSHSLTWGGGEVLCHIRIIVVGGMMT